MLKLNNTLKEASFSVNDSTQAGIWGWFKKLWNRFKCSWNPRNHGKLNC